jgi:hypothetical protein
MKKRHTKIELNIQQKMERYKDLIENYTTSFSISELTLIQTIQQALIYKIEPTLLKKYTNYINKEVKRSNLKDFIRPLDPEYIIDLIVYSIWIKLINDITEMGQKSIIDIVDILTGGYKRIIELKTKGELTKTTEINEKYLFNKNLSKEVEAYTDMIFRYFWIDMDMIDLIQIFNGYGVGENNSNFENPNYGTYIQILNGEAFMNYKGEVKHIDSTTLLLLNYFMEHEPNMILEYSTIWNRDYKLEQILNDIPSNLKWSKG